MAFDADSHAALAALIGVLLGAFFVPAAQAQAFLRNDRFDADMPMSTRAATRFAACLLPGART